MADALDGGKVSLRELGEYSMVREVAAAGWAAERRTQEDIEAMEALLGEMESQLQSLERYTEMDSQFHGLVAGAAKNKVSEIFNRAFSKLNRDFVLKGQPDASPEENYRRNCRVHEMHRNIFEAIRDGAKKAAEAMIRYMEAQSCGPRFKSNPKESIIKG